MMLLRLLILALILLLLLRLGWRVLHLIEPSNKVRKVLIRYFPLLEFGLWIWLVFSITETLFSAHPYYNVVVSAMAIILVGATGWYVLRDFLAGMLLKTENALEKGQFLKTEIASGKIQNLGYRSLILEADNGEKIRIAYSRLNELLLSRSTEEGSSAGHFIEMLVLREQKSAEQVKKDLTMRLLNMPWVITGFPPQVIVGVQDEHYFRVEIRFNVFNKDHVILIEENLKGHFGNGASK